MERVEIGILSQAINAAVVQLPGRRFPGIVLQGDSLRNLLSCATTVIEEFEHGDTSEAIDAAKELVELLQVYVRAYESAMHNENLDLPYVK